MADGGKSEDSCRLLALPSQNRNMLLACHSPLLLLIPSPPKMPWRQCCPSHAQGDPLQLQGPETFDPTLSCRKKPIRGQHLHFAVHDHRTISVFFVDRWQGREKLSREAVTIEGRVTRISLDTTVSAHPKASGRLASHRYSRRWRLSSHAGSWREKGVA